MGLSRAVHTNHAKRAAEKKKAAEEESLKPPVTLNKNDAYRSRTGEVNTSAQDRKDKRRAKQAEEVRKRKQAKIAQKKARQLADRIRKKKKGAKPRKKETPTFGIVTKCCSALSFMVCSTRSKRVAVLQRQETEDLTLIVTQVQRIARGRSSRQLLAEAEKSLDEYNKQHQEAMRELEEERLAKEKELMESHIKKLDSMAESHQAEVSKRMEILGQLRLARSGSLSPERFDSMENFDSKTDD